MLILTENGLNLTFPVTTVRHFYERPLNGIFFPAFAWEYLVRYKHNILTSELTRNYCTQKEKIEMLEQGLKNFKILQNYLQKFDVTKVTIFPKESYRQYGRNFEEDDD